MRDQETAVPSRITHHASRITLEQVKADVRTLSPQEQAQLRALLEDLLEDRLELTDSFKAEIEAGKKDIAEGRVRIRRP
jgi:predicted transcriptional regulator